MTINVIVNGEPQQVPEGLMVLDLLHHLDVKPERVAVELNRTIVRQSDWVRTQLQPGAQVEIVHFVGGG